MHDLILKIWLKYTWKSQNTNNLILQLKLRFSFWWSNIFFSLFSLLAMSSIGSFTKSLLYITMTELLTAFLILIINTHDICIYYILNFTGLLAQNNVTNCPNCLLFNFNNTLLHGGIQLCSAHHVQFLEVFWIRKKKGGGEKYTMDPGCRV